MDEDELMDELEDAFESSELEQDDYDFNEIEYNLSNKKTVKSDHAVKSINYLMSSNDLINSLLQD